MATTYEPHPHAWGATRLLICQDHDLVFCMSTNPFRGSSAKASEPMRVLHRFKKIGHCAEIRERTVTQFRAIEFLVFIDDSLVESQMFTLASKSNTQAQSPTAFKGSLNAAGHKKPCQPTLIDAELVMLRAATSKAYLVGCGCHYQNASGCRTCKARNSQ